MITTGYTIEYYRRIVPSTTPRSIAKSHVLFHTAIQNNKKPAPQIGNYKTYDGFTDLRRNLMFEN